MEKELIIIFCGNSTSSVSNPNSKTILQTGVNIEGDRTNSSIKPPSNNIPKTIWAFCTKDSTAVFKTSK
ncbi:MAG: hypothetical protein ACJ70W_00975, partial [Nitrososphaera sp.]